MKSDSEPSQKAYAGNDAGLIRKNTDGSLHVTEQCMARFGADFNLALLRDIRTCASRLESLRDEESA